MRKKILIADDEESIRFTFADFLNGGGYKVETADTLSNCIKKMQAELFDLLFIDVRFGVDNGIDAIQRLKVLQPDCAVVVITGNMDSKEITKARQFGALDFLIKPVRGPSLLYIAQKTLAGKAPTNQ